MPLYVNFINKFANLEPFLLELDNHCYKNEEHHRMGTRSPTQTKLDRSHKIQLRMFCNKPCHIR